MTKYLNLRIIPIFILGFCVIICFIILITRILSISNFKNIIDVSPILNTETIIPDKPFESRLHLDTCYNGGGEGEFGERDVAAKYTKDYCTSVLELGGGSGSVSHVVQKNLDPENRKNHVVVQPNDEKAMVGRIEQLRKNKSTCDEQYQIYDDYLPEGITFNNIAPFDCAVVDCGDCLAKEVEKNPHLFDSINLIQVERDDKVENKFFTGKEGGYGKLLSEMNFELIHTGVGCVGNCATEVWARKNALEKSTKTCGTNGEVIMYQTYKKSIPSPIVKQNMTCFPNCVRYEFFDDKRLNKFFKGRPEEKLFHDLKTFAHKVDLWRYIQLYETGGLYLDADSLLVKCLDKDIIKNIDALYLYDKTQDNVHNGFFYTKSQSPIIKNVIDSMVKIGTNIPEGGPSEGSYWYNLVILRKELEAAISEPLKNLVRPVEIRVDKYGWKIMFLTDRNNDFFYGPDGKEFYRLKHPKYPY